MPARKKSTAAKKLTGTYQPCRENQNAPIPDGELGSAPEFMTDEEKSTWQEIAKRIPEGVATDADRIAFEILVRLMVKFRSGKITGTETSLLLRLFQSFGMTPMHRDSVSAVPVRRKDNPFSKFGLKNRSKWK